LRKVANSMITATLEALGDSADNQYQLTFKDGMFKGTEITIKLVIQ
jgi:hypothetical protein